MFKFLKEKLKGAIKSFSSKVEEPEDAPGEAVVGKGAVEAPKKGFFGRLKETVIGADEGPEAPRPVEEPKTSIGADEFEKMIKEIDIRAPEAGEEEPEPVPRIEKEVSEEHEEEPPALVVPPPALAAGPRKNARQQPAVEVIKYEQKVRKIKPDGEVEEEPGIAKEPATPAAPRKEEKTAKPKAGPSRVEPTPKAPPKIEPGPVPEPSRIEASRIAEKLAIKKPAEGFFGRIAQAVTSKRITAEEFENLFWDLEVALMENNVAVEVIEKIKVDLKKVVVDAPLPRGKVEETILEALRQSLREVVGAPPVDLLEKVKEKRPYVVAFVGVNGSGKTTTIAKVAHLLLQHDLSVVLAAGDTFRAAAIDQLELHGKRLGVKVVKQDYGADPAAVAFDAIKHAEAKDVDVVLIDTAGRLHSNVNLVDEMKKIIRVAKPDLKLFVGESITGNDCVEQAQQFDEAVGIDGIILSKADVDEKGGAAISVSYVTKKPILFLGMGQEYADLVPFDPQRILSSLGL